MNALGLIFFLVTATALLLLPRRWAPVPLLAGCCYMTTGQGVELGPFSLPVIRMLLAVGVLRTILRSERIAGRINTMDWLMLAFCGWIFIASFFHNGIDSGPVFALGVIFNVGLVYYLTRVFCRTTEDLVLLIKVIAVLLIPVAIEMIYEKMTAKNLFAQWFGGVSEGVWLRNDRLRARGPFRHAILAGTVGAAVFPLLIGIRQRARVLALIGMGTTLFIVIASASSGPVMSLFFAIVGLLMWRFRQYSRYIPAVAVAGYVALELLMAKPAYYIISRIDIAGGSTGWHRSRLIEASITHLSEWWLFGTDFTRHWMPTGIIYSQAHTDITNYYLGFGVIAGLPAVLLMFALLWTAFKWVGRSIRAPRELLTKDDRFLIWCLGAGLFAHAATSLSVAYYDQSFVFFWFNVAVISSFHSVLVQARSRARRLQTATVETPPAQVPSGAAT